jgi:hypothetical protein
LPVGTSTLLPSTVWPPSKFKLNVDAKPSGT